MGANADDSAGAGQRLATGRQWPRGAVSAAIFRGGEVLLIERGKSGPLRASGACPAAASSGGPAGRVAALREVIEETGVVAELAGVLDVHEVFRRDPGAMYVDQFLLAVFYGRWISVSRSPATTPWPLASCPSTPSIACV